MISVTRNFYQYQTSNMAAIHGFSNEADLRRECCSLIAQKSSEAVKDHGFFSVGFSGGSLPKIVCPGLLSLEIDFSKWRVFFCDERYVPLTDADSNYATVKQHFLDKTSIAPEQVLMIKSDIPLDEAAKDYERGLKGWYPGVDVPTLDMLLLGMGPDGHTCSLFPDHPLLQEASLLVAPISDSPKPPPCRITLTYTIINAAKCAVFVSTGSSKAQVLKQVLEGDEFRPLPAARVKPINGDLHWFVDDAAASLLTKK
ncbi:6-phosphogluconolactonase-like [Acropora millepora]|uniref:6-phosphogluconolactonase-like n=1 Tax=Acropora millepora TaxID=45264 RepID=UPI001CF4B8A4|nr:6-phosphogluconolactonase-like [Acropora millepora]